MNYNFLKFLKLAIISLCILTTGCSDEDDSTKGDILFWKFTDILDCGPITVSVTINSKDVGTIQSDFRPYDSIPMCGAEDCLTVTKPIGNYDYKAECYCGLSNNLIGSWSGTVSVEEGKCEKIFLDVRKMDRE